MSITRIPTKIAVVVSRSIKQHTYKYFVGNHEPIIMAIINRDSSFNIIAISILPTLFIDAWRIMFLLTFKKWKIRKLMIPEQTAIVMMTFFSTLIMKPLTKSRVMHVPVTDNITSMNKNSPIIYKFLPFKQIFENLTNNTSHNIFLMLASNFDISHKESYQKSVVH